MCDVFEVCWCLGVLVLFVDAFRAMAFRAVVDRVVARACFVFECCEFVVLIYFDVCVCVVFVDFLCWVVVDDVDVSRAYSFVVLFARAATMMRVFVVFGVVVGVCVVDV